jgi:cyclopropane fatty-acyl-phospholipid synthase-like methyltransferase
MEKLLLASQMATRWTDPTIVLVMLIPLLVTLISTFTYGAYNLQTTLSATGYDVLAAWGNEVSQRLCLEALAWMTAPSILVYLVYNFWYHSGDQCDDTEEYLVFQGPNADKLRALYKFRKIPMCEFYEFFVDGDIAFSKNCEGGDCFMCLNKHRNKFVNYKVTMRQVFWLLSQFVPIRGGFGYGNSSMKDVESTTKEIEEHYDRGNAFFHAFMGDAMNYTSGIFKEIPLFHSDHGDYHRSAADGALEQAQFNKNQTICDKLQLKKDESFLDIGCGWGTLVRHAAREYGAKATGVTLSSEGKQYCDDAARAESCKNSEILHMDYRNIPSDRSFDKIASIEMAEHVGLNNFVDPYLKEIRERMTSETEGAFLMQVAGLRQGSNWEDVAWGLFMNKYIFPGADASTPLNWYVRQLELAGFAVQTVEKIGRHYSYTLHKWYDNWMSRKDAILSGEIDAERETQTGERLFRMWEFFLAYSVIASGQGSATCWQILAHPNVYDYNFDRWVDGKESMYGGEDRTGSYDYQPGAEAVLSDKAFNLKKKSRSRTPAKKKSTPAKKKSTRSKSSGRKKKQ